MKNFKKLYFILAAALLVGASAFTACDSDSDSDGPDEPKVTSISLKQSATTVEAGETVTFTVKTNLDTDVTANATITNVTTEEELTDAKFTPTEDGEYEFIAKYNEFTSATIKVTVATGTSFFTLEVTADKESIVADGTDVVSFTVLKDGEEDITEVEGVQVCMEGEGGVCLVNTGNGFNYSTEEHGEYKFYATYKDVKSPLITVTAAKAPVNVGEATLSTTRTLHKNVSFFIYTATWCGPCWYYKGYMKNVIAKYGDNITTVSIHGHSSDKIDNSNIHLTLESQMKAGTDLFIGGFPTSICEFRETLGDTGKIPTQAQTEAAYNKYVAYPAKTGIKVESAINDDKVEATVTVGAQVADTYYVGIMLIEDHVIAYQANGGNEYDHTNVFRKMGSANILGDELGAIAAGEEKTKTYSIPVEYKYNTDNLYLLVYTLYKDSETDKFVVANSVKAAVYGNAGYIYAN